MSERITGDWQRDTEIMKPIIQEYEARLNSNRIFYTIGVAIISVELFAISCLLIFRG